MIFGSLPWLVELILLAIVGTLVVSAFGAVGKMIVDGRVDEAEAHIAAMDAERRHELLQSYLQERDRMSTEQRRRWERVLSRQGLLDG